MSKMQNVITGNKIFSHLDRLETHRPITADVFLNNYCNNACPYCTYRRWEFENGARSMAYADFVRYATRLIELGVQGIILTGGGEPTISMDFNPIVRWLESRGIPYGINTNFNDMVYCSPRYLKVSLDAWDEDTYEMCRGVRAYQQVRDNIITFAEDKPDGTNIGIQLLATSSSSVYNFWLANRDLPVDYIVIRPVESTHGSYYQQDLDTEFKPIEIIKAIQDIQKQDTRVVANYKWRLLYREFDECIGQWSQIALNEIGEVMYCCHKPYQIVGHIMDEDILEKKSKAVTDMKMCDIPCRLAGVNHDLLRITAPAQDVEFI